MKKLLIPLLLILLFAPTAYAETVCSVHDGDTFRVASSDGTCKGIKVRIAGIDAPELKQPGGLVSRDYLEGLILGREVKLKCTSQTYDRQACRVWLDGEDVARLMVGAGLAYDYRTYSRGRYKLTELSARLANKGLWANTGLQKPWEYRASKRVSTSSGIIKK